MKWVEKKVPENLPPTARTALQRSDREPLSRACSAERGWHRCCHLATSSALGRRSARAASWLCSTSSVGSALVPPCGTRSGGANTARACCFRRNTTPACGEDHTCIYPRTHARTNDDLAIGATGDSLSSLFFFRAQGLALQHSIVGVQLKLKLGKFVTLTLNDAGRESSNKRGAWDAP